MRVLDELHLTFGYIRKLVILELPQTSWQVYSMGIPHLIHQNRLLLSNEYYK